MPCFKHLTHQDRAMIQRLLQQDHTQKSVAQILGVSQSTICRELRRDGMNQANYCAARANTHALGQRPHPPNQKSQKLWDDVEEKLIKHQWSPEQISGRRYLEGQETVSVEAIYLHIYAAEKAGRSLACHLRLAHRKRKKRRSNQDLRGQIKNRVSIDERPPEVDEKERLGDFELDTVVGPPGGAVLVTIVDRHSKYTLMQVASSKSAADVGGAILSLLRRHKDIVETLTFDNGKEFAYHYLIDMLLGCRSYFAHPYHSWERGLNENTNGLIRQYFPKKTDFALITDKDVCKVQDLLNSRPRKTLDYQTPNEIFLN